MHKKGPGHGHFGKKTKVGLLPSNKSSGERMHEMKTKPK
jgi:hypothetical protein